MPPTPPLEPSPALLRRLLAELSDERIAETWGPELSGGELRDLLLDWAATDPAVVRWIYQAWRATRSELIFQIGAVWPEDLAKRAPELVEKHGIDDVLLSLLTDTDEGGQEAVPRFLSHLSSRGLTKRVERILSRWQRASQRDPSEPRVFIVGGHPREAAQLEDTLAAFPCDVIWRTVTKGKGRSKWQQSLARTQVDAVVIVIGRIGHSAMESARHFAERNEIPYRCVARATRRQLGAAILELLAELQRE